MQACNQVDKPELVLFCNCPDARLSAGTFPARVHPGGQPTVGHSAGPTPPGCFMQPPVNGHGHCSPQVQAPLSQGHALGHFSHGLAGWQHPQHTYYTHIRHTRNRHGPRFDGAAPVDGKGHDSQLVHSGRRPTLQIGRLRHPGSGKLRGRACHMLRWASLQDHTRMTLVHQINHLHCRCITSHTQHMLECSTELLGSRPATAVWLTTARHLDQSD
jgi:hypothetical protein